MKAYGMSDSVTFENHMSAKHIEEIEDFLEVKMNYWKKKRGQNLATDVVSSAISDATLSRPVTAVAREKKTKAFRRMKSPSALSPTHDRARSPLMSPSSGLGGISIFSRLDEIRPISPKSPTSIVDVFD